MRGSEHKAIPGFACISTLQEETKEEVEEEAVPFFLPVTAYLTILKNGPSQRCL